MRNKILALAFLVGSFAFMPQEGVAGFCKCPPATGQRQECTEGNSSYTFKGGKGVHLSGDQCVWDCHCNLGRICKGAVDEPGKPGVVGKCVAN